MFQTSKMISTPVISVYDGQALGYITKILFCNKTKKGRFAIIVNENDDTQKILKLTNIYKIGDDAILVKNANKLDLIENYELELQELNSSINSNVVDLIGKSWGNVNDIYFDEHYKIIKISTKQKHFIIEEILNFTDCCTIVSNSFVKLSSFKDISKIPKPSNAPDTTVSIQNENQKESVIIDKQEDPNPIKAVTNYNFLLGRIATSDLKSSNGELIVRNNSKITMQLIDKARQLGKIYELAKYSKI